MREAAKGKAGHQNLYGFSAGNCSVLNTKHITPFGGLTLSTLYFGLAMREREAVNCT